MTITQDNNTKSLLERYGMANCNLRYTPGVGSDLFLDQTEKKLLNKKDMQRFQAITDSVMKPRTDASLRHLVLRQPSDEGDAQIF